MKHPKIFTNITWHRKFNTKWTQLIKFHNLNFLQNQLNTWHFVKYRIMLNGSNVKLVGNHLSKKMNKYG